MKRIFRAVFRQIKRLTNPGLFYSAAESAQVTISRKNTSIKGLISVGKNSTLTMEEDVQFNGNLHIGENCKVYIGKNCTLDQATFYIQKGSEMHISDHCVFDAPAQFPNVIRLEDHCKLHLSEHARVQAEVVIRFGGSVTMGTWSSINYLSEIRCDEQVDIGSYCLISYEVCIYDTNTHSTDWQERRKRIPLRASEETKPATAPVHIGNDVWIGKGATILKGVSVGDRSIIGIRTVVSSGSYPDDSRIVSQKPFNLKKEE
ncbi:MAG TPA: acyltransferase [Bacteroidia bacterium]|nr:acyltransferase [Bacteroidia bacterium]